MQPFYVTAVSGCYLFKHVTALPNEKEKLEIPQIPRD